MNEPDPAFPVDDSVTRGLHISLCSLVWTLVAGTVAVVIGVASDSLVLIAFGGLSGLDAAGSAALVVHFRHAIRHDRASDHHERVALRIITFGMAVLGVATAGEGIDRLVTHSSGRSELTGVVLAGVSLIVLASLSTAKRRIARRIPSRALDSDGWLSAMGSILAMVTLAGTALEKAFLWWWLDPVASLLVATGAIGLSYVLARGGHDSLGGDRMEG